MAEASRPVVAGIGMASALGLGKAACRQGLYASDDVIGVLQRPGRQSPAGDTNFLGAELPEFTLPSPRLSPRLARTVGLSGLTAIRVLEEAWDEAFLDGVDPDQVGLILGGTNLQAREAVLTRERYRDRLGFLSPRFGHTFFDSDLAGLCASVFGIRGFAYTVGGASASGALAAYQAVEAVRSGQVKYCVALGALQDLSYFELQGLRSLGAMGSERFFDAPGSACRPFDAARDGFLFGESAAALVFCREENLSGAAVPYGAFAGGALVSDANRGPEPSQEGEVRALRGALGAAAWGAETIDYVNTHGTGSPLGDDTEISAYREAGLDGARFNATKSIVGHGLAAAGAFELATTLLQLRDGRLHPCRNLEDPTDPHLDWVLTAASVHSMRRALKLSAGFGGINVALAIEAV